MRYNEYSFKRFNLEIIFVIIIQVAGGKNADW